MDNQLRSLYQERSRESDTLGILLIQKKEAMSPLTDGFDAILLVISQNIQEQWYVHHYRHEEQRTQVITVNKEELNTWLAAGSNRRAVEWILQGKILFDRNEYISSIKDRLEAFPFELRKKRLCIEFAHLIRRYQEGKDLYLAGHYLDAFNHILHALHHWARLAVIENGFHPELTLWRQVKSIDAEVYKLYDELVSGEESLEKKIDLLLIASEFSLASKTNLACTHLIEVMDKKVTPWEIQELLIETDLVEYSFDLSILLEHLIKKQIVKEVHIESQTGDFYLRAYQVVKPS
ncbi:nucleotidyltransferase-like protein [Bacillus horti]|uniref:Nucleotidyltransferase-like domain-containing protein n=1 Tax=Caldalkalibacillus horti TaxID=77523 RepID=A0ABT9W1H0_9BACI|nr:nucleotidyltransferase-like protein [Bacillus horti]MDQ0167088.1 hypothetical protein [Bacillus horti]